MSTTQPEALRENYTAADMATASAQGFRDGVASVAASAGSEPVAWGIFDSQGFYEAAHDQGSAERFCAHYNKRKGADPLKPYTASPLYTHPSPPEGMAAEQALRKVLAAVQRYLPPDGPSAKDTLTEIIEIVDPWPLGRLEKL